MDNPADAVAPEIIQPAFTFLQDAEISLLCRYAAIINVGIGEILFEAGDPAGCLFVLIKGQLAVKKNTRLGGKKQIIALLRPYAVVGEGSFAGNRQRTSAVSAVENSVLIRFERKKFDNLKIDNLGLATKLLEHLLFVSSKRLEKCSDRLAHIL